MINDNDYKIYLPSEYHVSTIFNVSDSSLFDVDMDLRTNTFKGGADSMTWDA